MIGHKLGMGSNRIVEAARRWFAIESVDTPCGHALLVEQHRALSRQIPLLYALMLISTGGVAYAAGGATFGSFIAPALLLCVVVLRMTHWLRHREAPTDPEVIRHRFRRMLASSAVLGAGYGAWAVSVMATAADGSTIAYVTLFAGITSFGCSYCLSSVPAAARLPLALATLPVTLWLLTSGELVLTAMGVCLALVAALILRMLSSYHEGFVELVSSRAAVLAERERAREAQGLAQAQAAKARAIARTDELTGLGNRRAFLAALDRAAAADARFAVAIVDLDGFKPVNDTLGHAAGDAVLREAGARIVAVAGAGATVARLGGDEFALLLPGRDGDAAAAVGAAICAALGSPFDTGYGPAHLSGSCGVAPCDEAGVAPGRLLDRADIALYHVKRNGRHGVARFDPAMEGPLRRRAALERALRRPGGLAELDVAFQPIVDLASGRLRGFEALARWDSAELGTVPPAEFLEVAARIGVLAALTDALVDRAVACAAGWPTQVGLSINLGARELTAPMTPLALIATLSRHGFDARRLSVEVSDAAVAVDFAAARGALGLLRAAGARVVLDDFGAAAGSLGYLREIRFDAVKIDAALIASAETSRSARALLKGVIDLCGAVEATCVAEAVETPEQAAILRELGCRDGQGWLFAPPLSAADAAALAGGMPGALRRAG